MRGWIVVMAIALGLSGAMVIGPFAAATGAPYVYGCTPVGLTVSDADTDVSLSIYNGSASAASLTHKILTANGTIMNNAPGYYTMPTTSTLPPTQTATFVFTVVPGNPSGFTVATALRIVSNVPVSATLSHDISGSAWKIVPCAALQP
jgi:hypothetical protein